MRAKAGCATVTLRAGTLGPVLALPVLALLVASPLGAASLQVSPTRFEFALDKPFTNFFIVSNGSEEELRVRIYPQFVQFDAENRPTELAQHPLDLAPWLVLNPRRVTLKPGERRIIRFSVRPPQNLQPGEYRTVVFFEELPGEPKPLAPGQAQRQLGLQINLLTKLGVSLYGAFGEKQHRVDLENAHIAVDEKAVTLLGILANLGNAHVTMQVKAELLNDKGEAVQQATENLVLQREQKRNWQLQLKRPEPGAYHLRFTGLSRDLKVFERTYPVEVKATPTS
ncbi:MAG: hypothetical protein HY423_16710 [Candidatus Lambdaproteobacteria bacterium]|nr:hypothetical protein [Candidatus Lambdaproteobacteria bacterium]